MQPNQLLHPSVSLLNRAMLSLVLTVMLLAANAQADLVLRYTFDDDSNPTFAADTGTVSPPANGAFVLNVGRTNQTPSGSGFALNADVSGNSYVSASNPAKLNNLTNLTITFWINLRTWMVGSADRVIDKTLLGAGTGGFGLRATSTGKQLTFGINSTTAVGPLSPVFPDTNQWLFCAVTYNGTLTSQNIQWFLGALTNAAVGASPATHSGWSGGPLPNNSANFRIGGTDASTGDRTPAAWIDDVRVYNSVLSPLEIESIRREVSNLPAEPAVLSFTANGVTGPSSPQVLYVTGGTNITLAAAVSGANPLGVQMYYNGSAIPSSSASYGTSVAEHKYVLTNGLPDYAGTFEVVVTNAVGAATNRTLLDITTIFDSTRMTNYWTVLPSSDALQPIQISGSRTRSMTYCPVSVSYPGRGSLLVAHWESSSSKYVQVMDPDTGVLGGLLADTDGSSVTMTIGNRGINVIGAADDGALYVGNVVISATNIPFYVYRYASDDFATVLPTVAFTGDPGGVNYPGMRWGDSIAVRGAAASTQILLAPGGGANFGTVSLETNVLALLRTSDGTTFTSTPIWITNAPARFGAIGVAFGPGANSCFVKNAYDKLYFIEFDPNTGLGWVKHASSLGAVPSCVTAIGTDSSKQLLGALSIETPDTFRLYSISNPMADAGLIDQAAFDTDNANTLGGGFGPAYGSVAFGSNFVYVLDANNGVKAFELSTNYNAPGTFAIASFQPETSPNVARVSWTAAAGRTYQVQSRDALADDKGWQRVGLPLLGTGATVSVTNVSLSAPSQRFYRVAGE